MALTHYYCDPSLGSDTGDGSKASPWGRASGSVVQWAWDNMSIGTDGAQLNVKSGATDVVSSPLSLGSGFSGTPGPTIQLVTRGYDVDENDGGMFRIEGGGTSAIYDNSVDDYVHFVDGFMGNTGSSRIIQMDRACSLQNIHFYDTSHTNPVFTDNYTVISDCSLTGWTNMGLNAEAITVGSRGAVLNCRINTGMVDCDGAIKASDGANISGNSIVLNNALASGIWITGAYTQCNNNSIVNLAAAVTGVGIYFQTASCYCCVFDFNAIEGFSSGIRFGVFNAYRSARVANNVFHNCTSTVSYAGDDRPVVEGYQKVATAPLFADPANGDFTITDEGRFTIPVSHGWGSTTNYIEAGANQQSRGGAADYPSEDHVLAGINFNSGANTGNMVLPDPEDVRIGEGYGTNGNDVGTLISPSPSNVRDQIQYDGLEMGTLKVPQPGEVLAGVETDNTVGTFEPANAADVKEGVQWGEGGNQLTGTYQPTLPSRGSIKES